ncbi:MAG TPA: IPT/TIG domain-containing protein [Candidatus Acidoferrales bacterium]|nr:IPT/TIG domain-containing protein [Candidatus Acidoferrales bacterium]
MPIQIAAGLPATLGVIAPNGHVEADVKILLSDGETVATDESGRAHFLAPASPGIFFARIQGTEICAAAEVRKMDDAKLNVGGVTRPVALNGQIELRGSGFEGDADKNEVIIGAGRALVLAASPSSLIVLPPPDSQPGTTELDVNVGGEHAATQITLVRVDVAPLAVPPDKKRKLSIRVAGTAEPVNFRIHNIQPDVVQILGKDDALLQTKGGSDNSVEIHVKGLRAGEFSFAVQLVHGIDVAGIPAARDFLEAAEKIAPAAEQRAFADILDILKKRNPDASAARVDLRRLAPEGLPGDYGALIRAANDSLFGADQPLSAGCSILVGRF